ncbi:class I SAM-dependent methyltransferase [Nocardia araoensis]|uniref:class I SAM-dependent methyltransferase n=1 Tax=Nocardia araoensis TaxID=228600 RepID=UPI00031709C1|nr:class I SAM-dependent methyltransferase [Nocardia araoensis]
MTDATEGITDDLFAGTAWHYARYRPDYPRRFFDDLVRRLRLDGTGRLLDLGCGTGQLTVPLARHVSEAVGMDPEPTMLVEAARRAEAAGLANVTWVRGGSEDLPGGLGRFRLVTIGQADRGRRPGVARRDTGAILLPCVHRLVHEFERAWTIEQAIGYLYSTSLPLHRLLGDRRAAFEQTITENLLAIDPGGCFVEPVTLEVLIAAES